MATREKKLSLNRKPIITSNNPKEVVSSDKPSAPVVETIPKIPNANKNVTAKTPTSPVKKLEKKTPPKKIVKKPSIAIKLKAKAKKPIKLNQKLAKTLLQNAKNLDSKKKFNNGIPKQRRAKNPAAIKKEKDCPPVLEPIFPSEDNLDKKPPKKKVNKRTTKQVELGKIKQEIDDTTSFSSEVTDASISDLVKPRKPRAPKKPKVENETIDDVMSDLTFLIQSEDIKKEVDDSMSESGKSDSVKPKKLTKKQKQDLLKKKVIKKETLENTLKDIDSSSQKIIDMLDLNVRNIKKESPVQKRRHSIEKSTISSKEGVDQTFAQSIFSQLPRSISPRSKRATRVRQSIEGLRSRRSSPYTTRSDSPARILRNGKHRKLKDMNLLDGLDSEIRKRRRLCSDLSGSEMSVSKLSGYESDSSYSDLASLHGAEPTNTNIAETVGVETKEKDIVHVPELDIKSKVSSETTENGQCDNVELRDTNSNLCSSVNVKVDEIKVVEQVKIEEDFTESVIESPSVKVPEKSIILDIMKQAFNEVVDDPEKKKISESKQIDTVQTSRFYGKSEETEPLPEIMVTPEPENLPDLIVKENNVTASTDDNDDLFETLELSATTTSLVDESDLKTEDESLIPEEPKVPEPASATESSETEQLVNGAKETSEKLENNLDVIDETLNKDEEQQIDPLPSISDNAEEGTSTTEVLPVVLTETPEEIALKESMLQALGLFSREAAKQKDSYTGTLKTVIKLNQPIRDKKRKRNPLKMTLQKNKSGKTSDSEVGKTDEGYKIMKEGTSSSWKQGNNSSDTADGSSEHTSDGEVGQDGAAKLLVIPEKASSFSIHPDRLCNDECSYCFGKFGLFDTPCHIAQMKSLERQKKVLATEKHLTSESCLCDACYRHVDRKSNIPSYSNKSLKRNSLVAPGPRQDHCYVLGCNKIAFDELRRKWIIKMRKSICETINIDLDNPGLHSIPVCREHYSALEHLMVCAMCKRKLARNHIHYLGPEASNLNEALHAEEIPLTLVDKPIVCKLCKYFATIVLKDPEERPTASINFYLDYKKRLLHYNNIVPMDEAAAEEPIIVPCKEKPEQKPVKKKKKLANKTAPSNTPESAPVAIPQVASYVNNDCQEPGKPDQINVPYTEGINQSRPESPTEYSVDYDTLIPAIAMDCDSDTDTKKEPLPPKKPASKKLPRLESVKEAIEISKNLKVKNKSKGDIVVQRLGSNPSISVRQLFPGEEELNLQSNIDFSNVKEKTPEGWEKCSSVIQYDSDTKRLWQDLQKPYGNQSSFLRHLLLLEKYFRNGDLTLTPNASHHSQNYSESVQNRLRAYDNTPTGSPAALTIKAQKSSSGIITSACLTKEPITVVSSTPKVPNPVTLAQLNSPPLLPSTSLLKTKAVGAPPGLISLHPGTNRPVAPLVKVPQSQKIKFPITKNWRPNLIPIDPSKKQERRPGLVQVISGGKPYHITLEDYKKMCAIKRSFEMKQKRLQEMSAATKPIMMSHSVLKSLGPRKGLTISKSTHGFVTGPKIEPVDESTGESFLDKMDRQIEKLDAKFNDKTSLLLPKIPKSLTVIPQTVARKPSRPSSPVLLITPKSSSNKS